MSSPGDNPPPSSSFRNSFSPLAPPGQSHPSSRSLTPGPVKPPVLIYTRVQNYLRGIASSVQTGAFNATPSLEISTLRNELFQLIRAWNGQYPPFAIDLVTPGPGPVTPMIVEPAPAATSDLPAPAPVSQMGPSPSYATAAASGATSPTPRPPQPQGKKAPAPKPAGKSKKTQSPATRPAALAAPVSTTPSRPDPLARVATLAAAFPTAPASQLIQVARELGPLPTVVRGPERPSGPTKPKVKHAPSGAMNTITVALSSAPLDPSTISNDGTLCQMFRDWLTSHPLPAADADGLLVEFVRWMPPSSFRVRFNKWPPPSLDNMFREFVLHYFTSPSDAATVRATAARFQFQNMVFFHRIPLQNCDGSPVTSDALLQDLRKDPHWASISITSPPRIHTPKSARGFGVLYVDFTDNAWGSVLRDVLKRSVLLHGKSCWAQAARSAKDYTTPRCTTCQKWGHRANHCRSIYKRCAHCSGLHDERDHTSKAPCCSGTGNVTCPHPPACANCCDAHRADSTECSFYKHRQDYPWIRSHQPGPHKPKSGMAPIMPTSQGKGKGKVGTSADIAMDEV